MINRTITFIALIFALLTITAGNGIAQVVKDSLPGIQDAIPKPWTCRIVVPTDSNEWPTGLDKPLFNAIFNDTENVITGCTPQETHPNMKLCFYPISRSTEIEDIIVKESIFSWCIPIKYLVSQKYFIATSPCYINNGCFSSSAQRRIAPLDSALANYFKPIHIQFRDSVIIDPHMFSGRVDPLFVIRDSSNVALLHRKIDSITTQINLNGTSVASSRSWWPGLKVTYYPLPISSKMYCPLEIGRDSISTVYQNGSRVLPLKNNDFEKTIIDILIKEKSVSIRGRDTIRAEELFESFNMITGILPDKFTDKTKPEGTETFYMGIKGTQIEFYLNAPSRTIVELFDAKGRVIDVVYKGALQRGVSKITLPQKCASGRFGILRVKTEKETKVVRTTFLK